MRAQDRVALGYTRPESYEELRAVLSSGTIRLPKRLRQVAGYLWQHPGEMALGTVTTVAKAAGVQPSTLVRFAQTLGFSGFSDLQEIFKSYVKASWPEMRETAALPGDRPEGSADAAAFIAGFVGSSARSLAGVGDRLDLGQFETATRLLAEADMLYIVGSKRAFAVASYLSLAFAKLGIRNFLIDNVGSGGFEQVGGATARDAFLAVSFTPYNSITPDLVAAASATGAAIVSITDAAQSPLAPFSNARIDVIEEDFAGFKSLAATLAVSMALVLSVAKARGTA